MPTERVWQVIYGRPPANPFAFKLVLHARGAVLYTRTVDVDALFYYAFRALETLHYNQIVRLFGFGAALFVPYDDFFLPGGIHFIQDQLAALYDNLAPASDINNVNLQLGQLEPRLSVRELVDDDNIIQSEFKCCEILYPRTRQNTTATVQQQSLFVNLSTVVFGTCATLLLFYGLFNKS